MLSSEFFLNDRKFLHGIDGRPDAERVSHFREALARARRLARERQESNRRDVEALFALTLAAGMESDEESILEKRHLDALKRMKEAREYAKKALEENPDCTDAYIAPALQITSSGRSAPVPLRPLVWRNSWRQKAGNGATG